MLNFGKNIKNKNIGKIKFRSCRYKSFWRQEMDNETEQEDLTQCLHKISKSSFRSMPYCCHLCGRVFKENDPEVIKFLDKQEK